MGRRRAQSAVETMLLVPVLLVVMVATYQLFTLTFAAQNAHLRAREHVLHGGAYLQGRAYRTSGSTVFDEGARDYRKAAPGAFRFESTSSDRSIPGVGTAGEEVTARAVITSE